MTTVFGQDRAPIATEPTPPRRLEPLGAVARRWLASRWVLPVAIVAASACVSTPGALRHSLWGDEVASARILDEQSIGDALERVRRTESTPPAWYAAAWGALRVDQRLTGGLLLSPVERVRLFSVLVAACASVLTALWALRLLGDRLLAALAGFLVALGSAPAAHAEQLRAYALLTLVSVGFGLLLVVVSSREGAWLWVGLSVSVALGTLTHYFFAFTVLAGLVWLWLVRPRPRRRRSATGAIAVGAVGFLPWLIPFVEQIQHRRYSWIGPFDAASVAALPGSLFFHPAGHVFGTARIALTAGLVIGLGVLWQTSEGRAVAALGVLPVVGAASFWAAGQPIFNSRNLLAVAPYVAIVVAASLTKLPRQFVTPAAATCLAITAAGALYTGLAFGRVDYNRVADDLLELGWSGQDPVTFDAPTGATSLRLAVAWYLPGHPTLEHRVPTDEACAKFYAIGHVTTLGPWLVRHRGRVDGVRELRSYDHPVSGRRDGHLLVARLHGAIDTAGDLFTARGQPARCVTSSRASSP